MKIYPKKLRQKVLLRVVLRHLLLRGPQPAVKLRCSFFSWCFSICNASIKSGLMRFLRFVSVSALDEKTLSQGTEEAWIGR